MECMNGFIKEGRQGAEGTNENVPVTQRSLSSIPNYKNHVQTKILRRNAQKFYIQSKLHPD